jgi:hypothetical protein
VVTAVTSVGDSSATTDPDPVFETNTVSRTRR